MSYCNSLAKSSDAANISVTSAALTGEHVIARSGTWIDCSALQTESSTMKCSRLLMVQNEPLCLLESLMNCNITRMKDANMHEGHSGSGATDQTRSARCAFTLCHTTYSNADRADYWHAIDAFVTGCDKCWSSHLGYSRPLFAI